MSKMIRKSLVFAVTTVLGFSAFAFRPVWVLTPFRLRCSNVCSAAKPWTLLL